MGGLQYTRYLTETLAVTFAIEGVELETGSVVASEGAFSGVADLAMFPVGVRWNPLSFGRQTDAIKPFFAFGVGPVIGDSVGSFAGSGTVVSGAHTNATVGGYLRGGADFHLARSFAIGVEGGYNWMADFAQPVGLSNNYSGFGMSLGFGWLFGRGTAGRP
jgi:hypothetical protein